MADVLFGVVGNAIKRLKDMLDGSWAEVVATVPTVSGSPLGPLNPMPVGERFISPAATTLTRPANTTAYSIGDEVGGVGTAVSLGDTNDAPFSIEAIRIDTADTGPGTATATFECWVYNVTITPAADNAAFTSVHTGLVGRFSGTWIATSDGSFVILTPVEGSRRIAKPLAGAKTVNLDFKTLTAWTPSANSTVFNIVVEGFQGRA